MIDRGFLRIAIGLAVLVAISAAAVGIYLYYNFNVQSRLPLIVPESSHWFVQIQTKKLKEEYKGNKPPYYDSFYQLIANAPVFKGCEDAGTPGIGLFSDVVLFETQNAKFMGLSVTSETKLSAFLDVLKSKNIVHGKIQKDQFTYVKLVNKNLYVAFKYKAMVFMEPNDSSENVTFNEKALSEVFSGKESKFIHAAPIQKLYDQNAHVIWYHKHLDAKSQTTFEFARGFNLKKPQLDVIDVTDGTKLKSQDNRIFPCLNFTSGNIYDAKNLCLGIKYYENKENCFRFLGIDTVISAELKNDAVVTSENYLNTLFKGAFEYLKHLK